MEHLEAARQALEDGHDALALRLVREAWLEVSHPRIAAVAVGIDQRLPRVAVTNANWSHHVARAETNDLGSLLEQLVQRSIERSTGRIRDVARLGPDPRIGAALERLITDVPWTSNSSQGLWLDVFRIVATSGDPRFLLLRNAPERWTCRPLMVEWLAPRLQEAIDTLEQGFPDGVPALDPAWDDAVSALERWLAPVESSESVRERLYAAVYASPHDDAPRRVLADWLIEQGDPVGEYIALSLEADLPPEAERRRRSLERTHHDALCEPLGPVLLASDRTFERGFLSGGAVRFRSARDIELGGHPAWATVTSLRWAGHPHVDPAMRSLREVSGFTGEHLRQIAEGTASYPIERMAVALEADGVRAFRACPVERLPALRQLALFGSVQLGAMQWLYESPLGKRLTHVDIGDVTSGSQSVAAWADDLEASPSLVEATMSRFDWRITLRRDAAGRFSEVAFVGARRETLGYWNLDALPEDRFSALTVEISDGSWDAEWRALVEPAVARMHTLKRVQTPDGVIERAAPDLPARAPARPTLPLAGVRSMAWAPDGSLVLLGAQAVITLDPSGAVVDERVPDETPASLALGPGVRVLAGPRWLEITTGAGTERVETRAALYRLELTPDGRFAVGIANAAEVWDLAARTMLKRLSVSGTYLASAAISPDGTRVALGTQNGPILLRPVEGRARLGPLEGHTTRVGVMAWSADGRFLVSGSDDGSVRGWDVESATELWNLGGGRPVVAAGFSDGAFLVVDWAGTRRIHPDGRLLHTRPHTGGRAFDACIAADGSRVAYTTADRLQVWDPSRDENLYAWEAG
ncbi:MAG: TIGR02996 domain-containing protein [Alphaproteobacteria bacterium]|nr:TIGR02996 domain-containing protein [Alphaproteobacteria bacterium]